MMKSSSVISCFTTPVSVCISSMLLVSVQVPYLGVRCAGIIIANIPYNTTLDCGVMD